MADQGIWRTKNLNQSIKKMGFVIEQDSSASPQNDKE
jgi:hypothetical protein